MDNRQFLNSLKELEGKLAVASFGNPDPDSIASAYSLGQIVKDMALEFDYLFEAEVNRPENQALVNYLDMDINKLEESSLDDYDYVSLLDCNPERLLKIYPEDFMEDLYGRLLSIQDHHPISEEEMERLDNKEIYTDIRPELGSCATILAENIQESDIDFSAETATALYYGLYSDTRSLRGEFTTEDFAQAVHYVGQVDQDALIKIEGSVMTSEAYEVIHRATDTEFVERRGTYKFADAGTLTSKDKSAIPQVADLLVREEGVNAVVVAGIDLDKSLIIGSVRYSGSRYTAEDIAEKIADGDGTGGGHMEMGGFQVKPGVLQNTITKEASQNALMDSIKERFFEAVGKGS